MIQNYIKSKFPGEFHRKITWRNYLVQVCENFVNSGLADPKFVMELTSGSEQKFWACVSEALIADRLRGKEFGVREIRGKGPDFIVMEDSRKVWIEVVCPEPINISEDWLDPQFNGTINFPHEDILLCWTSAIKAKAEALIGSSDGRQKGYLKSRVVLPDDAYVIAVNGCQLRSGPFPALLGISQFPFAAEAVFPIGPYQVRIDRETLKVVDQGYQHRPYVLNKNGAMVPAYTFLDPQFNPISAIWAVDLNGGTSIGNVEPTAIIHNPNATNPISIGFLPADSEYVAVADGDNYVLSNISSREERSS